MKINENEIIWVEKYRPQLVDDLVLPDIYVNKFKEYIKNPTNILLYSETPGTGKTSTLNAIIREGEFESLFINASLENGIDVLRNKIANFASSQSFNDKAKIVILDEFDAFSDSGMSALRGFIEEFSSNCRFIITCNYINKVLPAIINRFEVYDFDKVIHSNTQEMVKKIFSRLKYILDNEKIKYDDKDIITIINGFYPSIRGMIGQLQKSVFNNEIKLLDFSVSKTFEFILEKIKTRNYDELLKSIYNLHNPDSFYTWMFKNIENAEMKNRPQIITILAKYQFQASSVRDKNLNLAACCTELAPFLA